MQSRMVDYALVIRPDSSLVDNIKKKLNASLITSRSINYTTVEHVSLTLIAISMKTKCAAINEKKAHLQLAT